MTESFLTAKANSHWPEVPVDSNAAVPERRHFFEAREIDAVNTALAARRPLLIKGEPGTGKTQLAWAVAGYMNRPLIRHTVDAHTEARDLMWQFDAVSRLADAQLCAVPQLATSADEEVEKIDLSVPRYVQPKALWWAFDWPGAVAHLEIYHEVAKEPKTAPESCHSNGCVLLIDEIDKADSQVPNGLLEALGERSFHPPECDEVVANDPAPLVIITSNDEQALPPAFERRCVVLHLNLPESRDELIDHLVVRGRAHFPAGSGLESDVIEEAAKQLAEDRQRASDEEWYPLPGQAEYLDLLRVVKALSARENAKSATQLLQEHKRFTYRKNQHHQKLKDLP